MASNEERERMAEYSSPCTYYVVHNSDSFNYQLEKGVIGAPLQGILPNFDGGPQGLSPVRPTRPLPGRLAPSPIIPQGDLEAANADRGRR